MNAYGFSINLFGITLSILWGADFEHIGLGGDVIIEPNGEHPGIFFRTIFLFGWLKVGLYFCDHDH